jgi:plastocyanin
MRFVPVFVVLLALAGAGFAQGTGKGAEQDAGKEVYVASVDKDGVQRVEVRAGGYFFDPDHIVVKEGVPVELTVSKEPGMFHDIVMKEPQAGMDFKVELDKDEPKVIRFTPTKAGKYPFYCDKKFLFFKSHRARGMEGVMEVVE